MTYIYYVFIMLPFGSQPTLIRFESLLSGKNNK